MIMEWNWILLATYHFAVDDMAILTAPLTDS